MCATSLIHTDIVLASLIKMACPGQIVAGCMTLVLIMVNAKHNESPSRAVNESFHASCIPVDWAAAEMMCKKKQGAIFELDDLKHNYVQSVLQAALQDVGEMWISRDTNGGCMKAVKSKKTAGRITSADEADQKPFQKTSCSELHHYVCKLNMTSEERSQAKDLKPHYVPCQGHPASSGYIYMTLLGVGLVLVVSITAVYHSVRRLGGAGGRLTGGHSDGGQDLNDTQSDHDADIRDLETEDGAKEIGFPVEQIDRRSEDTDNGSLLVDETFDTYEDFAAETDNPGGHLSDSLSDDGTAVVSDCYDNVTYHYDL